MKTHRVLISLIILMYSCTDILNDDEKLLRIIEVPNKEYKIKVVYQPSNATIQAAIQVRRLFKDKKEDVLKTFERYNYLDTLYLQKDTSLVLILKDTVSYLGNKPDTMNVTLN
jgi:hypothetical protein